ncbi:RNA polymerase sigma factor [Limnochorda sp.]|uniref:RNA polymerase sigma factor n=1 Tax=Limnochorda sp. TaxID=1940279 RepID=UPI00396D6FD9
MHTDDEIIRLCQQGRSEGFALLLDRYQVRVYRRAYTFLRDREDALDAAQEVFMRVLQAIRHFERGRAI